MSGPWEAYQRKPWEEYQATEEPKSDSALDSLVRGTGALASGVNRGVLRLFGLPADTVANAIDLLKAGAGMAYSGATGKTPPEFLDPTDKAKLPLTGDWMESKVRQFGGGDVIGAGAREFPKVHSVGVGIGSSMVPVKSPPGSLSIPMSASIPRSIASNAAWGGTAAGAGALAYDVTGREDAAILASMLAPATKVGGEAAIRKAIGSNPSQTQARLKAFKDAGVDEPSAGLATGNRFASGLENLLGNTPGSMSVVQAARDRIIQGLLGKIEATRNLASNTYSPTATGKAIQRDGNAFDASMIEGRKRLYGLLDQKVPPQTPTGVTNTTQTLSALNADIPGAPNLSKQFKNARIMSIEDAMRKDLSAAGTPAQSPTFPGGPATPAQPATELPWQAIKQARTLVGQEISDANMMSTVPRSKWNPLYGALSSDMGAAVQSVGPDAARAFNRATNYTRAGAERADLIEPIVKASTPEKAWSSVESLGKGGTTMFQALKKSVTPETRAAIAATKIDRMGRANPSLQTDAGDVWSPETFLTNYNKMDPKARAEFFSGFPNAPQVQRDLDAVAKAASMLRDSAKVWSNPSGTAQNLAARGAIATLGGSILLAPFVPGALGVAASTGGTMIGANAAARMMTNQKFIGWLAKGTEIPPGRVASHLNRLAVMANASGDDQFKADVAEYLDSLNK